ncbi:MAG: hypothetical protein H6648_08820 [Caldilineae bacterium]|nr:hypothetical protein [Caldilineae bacterium]
MRDIFAGVALVLGLTIGGGFAWAISRTWTGEHTTFLLGGIIALCGLLGLAAIVGAWSYGVTHGAGAGVGQAGGRVIDVRPRRFDPHEERLLLDNAIRRERLLSMQAEREPELARRVDVVPDWADQAGR